jgi:hypothetical protein
MDNVAALKLYGKFDRASKAAGQDYAFRDGRYITHTHDGPAAQRRVGIVETSLNHEHE